MKNEIEEQREFDDRLRRALRPDFVPDETLNLEILAVWKNENAKTKRRAMKKWYALPRVAVAAAALVLLSSVGVYAAAHLLKKPTVTEHAISVGNTEYVDDEAIAREEAPVEVKQISSEEGDGSVKWNTRTVTEVNGYITEVYTYTSYADALEAAGISSCFTVDYPMGNINYSFTEDQKAKETDGKEGYRTKTVSADFAFHKGRVFVTRDRAEAGVDADAAYSVKLSNTSNQRDYTSKSGLVFTLVDSLENDEKTTTVMISDDSADGFLQFQGLTEDEIKEVLETVR